MRDYQLVSPSLDGILRHDSIEYEGVRRPTELASIMDRPRREARTYTDDERKVLYEYCSDLYAVFTKKFAAFAAEPGLASEEAVKLQALLQEMIKIKGILGSALR